MAGVRHTGCLPTKTGMKMTFEIQQIDHIVLTVADIDRTCRFYEHTLGMTRESFGEGRTALRFGSQKINLHLMGQEVEPKAAAAGPGTGDICFITHSAPSVVKEHLENCGVAIQAGPVTRTGAMGPITSFYFRDPDGNLIEVSRYDD